MIGSGRHCTAAQVCDFGAAPGYWRLLPGGQRQWALFDDVCLIQDLLSAHLQVALIINTSPPTLHSHLGFPAWVITCACIRMCTCGELYAT